MLLLLPCRRCLQQKQEQQKRADTTAWSMHHASVGIHRLYFPVVGFCSSRSSGAGYSSSEAADKRKQNCRQEQEGQGREAFIMKG